MRRRRPCGCKLEKSSCSTRCGAASRTSLRSSCLALLIVAFAIWGIGDVVRRSGQGALATVGKTEISVRGVPAGLPGRDAVGRASSRTQAHSRAGQDPGHRAACARPADRLCLSRPTRQRDWALPSPTISLPTSCAATRHSQVGGQFSPQQFRQLISQIRLCQRGAIHPGPPARHPARAADRDLGCRPRAAGHACSMPCFATATRRASSSSSAPDYRQADQDGRTDRQPAARILRAEHAPIHCARAAQGQRAAAVARRGAVAHADYRRGSEGGLRGDEGHLQRPREAQNRAVHIPGQGGRRQGLRRAVEGQELRRGGRASSASPPPISISACSPAPR